MNVWRRLRNRSVPVQDGGSIAVVFAGLLGSGLLLGLLALSFDSGAVFFEKRIVQTGADAAAEGLVVQCAVRSASCSNQANAAAYAQTLANANAPDLLTRAAEICGLNTPTNPSPLTSCSGLPTLPRGGGCTTTPTAGRAYVRVTTKTMTETGDSINVPFTKVLSRSSGTPSTVTMWGCSQANWGKVATADIRLELALPPCSYSTSGIVKLRVTTGNIVATSSCGYTSYADNGGTATTAGVTTSMGSSSSVKSAFSPSFASAGTCVAPFSITASGTGTSYTRESSFSNACNGNLLSVVSSLITAGTFEPVPIGLRSSNSALKVLTFAAVKFLASCTKTGSSASSTCQSGLVGVNGSELWPASCSATQPCLRMQFGSIVNSRATISWTATSALPNMGVQAVQMLR